MTICQIAFQQLSLQKIQSVGKLSRNIPDVYKEAIKNFTDYITQRLVYSSCLLLLLFIVVV